MRSRLKMIWIYAPSIVAFVHNFYAVVALSTRDWSYMKLVRNSMRGAALMVYVDATVTMRIDVGSPLPATAGGDRIFRLKALA